jgi:hypothetical protein
MKKHIITALLFLSIISCSEKRDFAVNGDLSLDKNSISLWAGQSWLYKQTFITSGLPDTIGIPDTLVGYSFFHATKDTSIDSTIYLIIEGRDYDVEKDSVYIIKKRYGIHSSDSEITQIEFETGMENLGFTSGVMKHSPGLGVVFLNKFGTFILKRHAANQFNSAAFYDYVVPIKYPLVYDSIYVYRDTGSINGNSEVSRQFLGIENISVGTGNFDCYKFKWLTNNYWPGDSVIFCDWIGDIGLVKRLYYDPTCLVADDAGVIIDTCILTENYEIIGNRDINSDTLIPWGKRNQ